ncbi:unnamed protein product, partial [Symbiodinium microadriaticum]
EGLAAPIPFSYVDLEGFPQHPWLRPSDFLRVFVKENKLGLLTGGNSFDVLEEFWRRYSYVEPSHAVFKLLDAEQRRFTIPCMLYADEGQTLKKQSLMVVSIQPAIGAGIRAAEGYASSDSMGNNFIGAQTCNCASQRRLANIDKAGAFDPVVPQVVLMDLGFAGPGDRSWFKGHDTTVVMLWLEAVFAFINEQNTTAYTRDITQAIRGGNEFLRCLYKGGLWLSKDEAETAIRHSTTFCWS